MLLSKQHHPISVWRVYLKLLGRGGERKPGLGVIVYLTDLATFCPCEEKMRYQSLYRISEQQQVMRTPGQVAVQSVSAYAAHPQSPIRVDVNSYSLTFSDLLLRLRVAFPTPCRTFHPSSLHTHAHIPFYFLLFYSYDGFDTHVWCSKKKVYWAYFSSARASSRCTMQYPSAFMFCPRQS